jgi:predicted nucleotidyltransferase
MSPKILPGVDELCQRLREVAETSGSELCVLFGSRGRSSGTARSDVDLALSYRVMPSPEQRLQIIGLFQAAAGHVPVDVVFLHRDTDPVLRFEIFRSGQTVFEESPGVMVEARVRAFMSYEDALPLRRLRRESLSRVS